MPNDTRKPGGKDQKDSVRDLPQRDVSREQGDSVKGGRAPQRPRPAEPVG